MLHLENNAFARRKPLHRRRNPRLNLFPKQPPFRIECRAVLALPLEKVGDPFIRMSGIAFWRLIFRPRLPPPQMVQANIGDDAIQPGVKAAFKAETMEIAVDLQESFLINVARVLGTLHQIQRQPQHVAVIAAHQFLESSAASGLRFRDYAALVKLGQSTHRGQGAVSGSAEHTCQSQSRKWHIRFLFATSGVMALGLNTLAQVYRSGERPEPARTTHFGRAQPQWVSSHPLSL